MTGFPVSLVNAAPPAASIESLKDSLATAEGFGVSTYVNTTMTLINAASGNGLQIGSTYNSPAGKAMKVNGILLSSSIQIDFFARVNQSAVLNTIEKDIILSIPPNSPQYIPVEWVIRSAGNILFYAKKAYGAVDACVITLNVIGHYVTDDFTPNTKRQMLFVGDSITAGTGTTNTWNMYQVMMKNYLRQKGCSIKLNLMGISGSQVSNHLNFLAGGRYDIGQLDLVCIALGVNDAKNLVDPAAYKAGLQLFINWALNHPENKTLNICLIGPSPLQAVAAEAAAVILRGKVAELVSENNNPRLFGFDLGGAFTSTVYANYVASDPNGTAVHPNDASHLLMFNQKCVPFFQSINGLRLIANLQ